MFESANEPMGTVERIALTPTERSRLLAAERRRVALDILAGQTTSIDLETLAERIAIREAENHAVDEKTVERVAVTLHHTHLPHMDDVGVLDYHSESHRIEPDRTLRNKALTAALPHG